MAKKMTRRELAKAALASGALAAVAGKAGATRADRILDVTEYPWVKPALSKTEAEHAYFMGQVVARTRALIDSDEHEQIFNFGGGPEGSRAPEVDVDQAKKAGLGTFGIWTEHAPADLDLYQRILPRTCSMPDQPVVSLWTADYNQPNPVVRFRECGVMLKAVGADGEEGLYVHAMPVDSWVMLAVGHDWGYRKELCDLTVTREQTTVMQKDGKLYMSLELTGDEYPADAGSPLSEGADGRRLDGMVIYPKNPDLMLRTSNNRKPIVLEERKGMVKISVNRALDWAGLIPEGAVAPGYYRRFLNVGDYVIRKVWSS